MIQSPSARAALALTIVVLAVLALVALPSPAAAETYIVTTVDGGRFESRYQPQEASWDSGQILFLTEFGNWIALDKSDISSVKTETENKGYGRVINTTTIALGWAPNDAEIPGEEGAEGQQQPTAADMLRDYLNRPEKNYDIEQFVEPGDTGGGLPVTYGAGVSTTPIQ